MGVAGIGVGTGVCKAEGPLATTGDDVVKATASGSGTGTGNAVALNLDVPVAACGLGGAVIGVGTGVCEASGPLATTGDNVTKATAEGDGFIAGNAIAGDLDVPVAVCGVGAAGHRRGHRHLRCHAARWPPPASDTTTATASGRRLPHRQRRRAGRRHPRGRLRPRPRGASASAPASATDARSLDLRVRRPPPVRPAAVRGRPGRAGGGPADAHTSPQTSKARD